MAGEMLNRSTFYSEPAQLCDAETGMIKGLMPITLRQKFLGLFNRCSIQFLTILLLLFAIAGTPLAQAQRLYDGSGRQIGRVDGDRYYDGSGRQIGRQDGMQIYDGSGRQIGRIDSDRVYDGSGRQIGRIDGERLYSGSGSAMGRIDGDRIYDASGRQIGRTDGLRRMQIIICFYFFM